MLYWPTILIFIKNTLGPKLSVILFDSGIPVHFLVSFRAFIVLKLCCIQIFFRVVRLIFCELLIYAIMILNKIETFGGPSVDKHWVRWASLCNYCHVQPTLVFRGLFIRGFAYSRSTNCLFQRTYPSPSALYWSLYSWSKIRRTYLLWITRETRCQFHQH